MRLAFIIDQIAPYYVGGYEVRLSDYALRLVQAGHHVDVYTSCPETTSIDGVNFIKVLPRVDYFGRSGFRRLHLNVLYTIALLRFFIVDRKYDIVDANATPWLHLPVARLLAKRWNSRFVITAHEALLAEMTAYFGAKGVPFPKLFGSIARSIYLKAQASCDAIIAASPNIVASLTRELDEEVVPVFVAAPGQDRIELTRTAQSREGCLRVIFAARHVQLKRLDIVLEAFHELRGVSLEILGSGPLTSIYQKQAQRLNLTGVTFHGNVSDARKRQLFASCEAFILASPREGYSVATMEAMASGCVPLFAYVPHRYETGVTSYIIDGENGVSFDGSSAHLRCILEKLRDDVVSRSRLRLRAWESSAVFSWRARIESLQNIYEAVLSA